MHSSRATRRRRTTAVLLASLGAASTITSATAQTSGTWAVDVGATGGSWSNPSNWSGGVVPDNGGIALFNTMPSFTTAPVGIIQDQPTITLSGLTFDSFITYLLKPTVATNNITLTGPATINTAVPSINTLNTTVFGQQSQLPFAGGAGLTKTGPGTLTLWATNIYTGGTTVNGGILVVRQFGDLTLGAAGGGGVTLNDGTIRVTTSGWTSSRAVNFAGAGTIEATTTGTTTFNGAVGGAGTLNKAGSRGLILTASNSFTGAVNVLAGSIGLSGNGSLQHIPSIVSRDTLTVDDSGTNLADRLNDAAPITLQGSNFTLSGNATGITSETIGAMTFSRGTTVFTLSPNGSASTVNAGAVSRDTGAVAFFRGDNLGTTPPAPSVAKIAFSTPPSLVGGGGAGGSTNVSIIPWAYGNSSSVGSLNTATSSFVTYGPNGIRPLDTTTEYATSIGTAGVTDNVRLIASQTLTAPATINSLVLANASAIAVGGAATSTLTISSGGLLALGTGTISAPIDFGSAQGILIAPANITLGGTIAGSGGLTKQGVGIATFANAANTYTGTTIIGGGTATFSDNVPKDAPSPFGNSSSAIVLAPAGLGTGGSTARLLKVLAGNATFDRDLIVSGRVALNNNATLPGFGVSIINSSLVMNGNILLDNSPLAILGPASFGTVTLNGNISGTGPITDSNAGGLDIFLNGNNTFTDGVEMSAAIWSVGSDSAFGSGMIKMVQTSGSPTIVAVGGPRVVPNDTVSFSFSSAYWSISGTNDITFTGSINLSGSYVHNITNTGTTTYAGVLHTGGFTKVGPGLLVLSGSNIYTGQTVINNGVLRITNDYGLGVANAAPYPTSGPDTFLLGTLGAGTQNVVVTPGILELANNINTPERIIVRGNLGTATQTVDATTNFAPNGNVRNIGGNNTISGPVYLNANVSVGVDAGSTLAIAGPLNDDTLTNAGALQKVGAGKLTVQNLRLGGANAINAGTVAILSGRTTDRTSNVRALTIAGGATFDLADNDLVVDYGATSPLATIATQIGSAYNGGSWNGTGLTSSAAAAAAAGEHRTALGDAESAAILGAGGGTFSGQSVDGTSVLVRYTYAGDGNLDGTVDLTDFTFLAANFNKTGAATWLQGDFNYDGNIDLTDFSLLASNFNQSLPTDGGSLGSAVPEPSALALAVACLTSAALQRRRRRD